MSLRPNIQKKPFLTMIATVAIVGVCGFIWSKWNERKLMETLKMNAIFAPQTIMPTSFDPLDADHTNNIWVMRMLNLTPIEVSVSNRLTSQILSSFSYDLESSKITFIVRHGLQFSDDSPITPEDVAFSIARMAFTRPKFPVIAAIVGLSDWLKNEYPLRSLPKGISINDNVITISFARKIDNPLFRFALEIFSIIPKSSVDLDSNRLLKAMPPTSGNYVISSKLEHQVKFNLRMLPEYGHQIKVPKSITFEYFESGPDLSSLNNYPKNMVFAGLELDLRQSHVNLEKQGLHVIWTPASNFAVVNLNPNMAPFNLPSCRRAFAKTLREEVGAIFGDNIGVEPSLFPSIVPGYLKPDELINATEAGDCTNGFAGLTLKWTNFPSGQNDFYNQLIKRTANRLGINLLVTETLSSLRDHEAAMRKMETFCAFGRSGFWPLDPVGDIRMLFTPHMHMGLEIVWSDQNVTAQLDALGLESNPNTVKTRMQVLNKYFAKAAIFNVVAHFRSFFASSGANTLRDIPLAVQQPYAWQAFKIE
jgi:ABC-type transport system substrate-binding protein